MPQTIHIPVEGIIGSMTDSYGFPMPGFEAFMLDYFVGYNPKDASIGSPELQKVVLHVNSDGGSVTEGFAIFNKLQALKEKGVEIETVIEGKAYSIATVIALAGTTVKAREASMFMVHKPWTGGEGNADDLRSYADYLDQHERPMVAIYAAKTGKSESEITDLLRQERFMSAREAKEWGFVDEIIPVSIPRPQGELKAVAFYNPSKPTIEHKQMTEEQEKSLLDKFVASISSMFTLTPKAEAPETAAPEATPEAVAASTSTEQGTLYHEGEAIEVGTLVFSDEALSVPAETGEYVAEAGTILVTEGQVTEIQANEEQPAPAEEPAASTVTQDVLAQVKALKAEVTALRTQLTVKASSDVPGAGNPSTEAPQNFSNDTAKAEPFAQSAINLKSKYKSRR